MWCKTSGKLQSDDREPWHGMEETEGSPDQTAFLFALLCLHAAVREISWSLQPHQVLQC